MQIFHPDNALLELNQKGFFLGPKEEKEAFLARVKEVEKIFSEGDAIPSSHWDWVRAHLNQLFDFEPFSLPVFYSNRSLAPWQAAASWIEGDKLHSIQLRESLRKGAYLKLYRREEILAHEAVHAARSALKSDRWEEYFAYMTSEKRWRRVLGPLMRKPWEAWPFLLSSLVGVVWDGGLLFALAWMALGLGRLLHGHWILRKAAAQIRKCVEEERKVRSILIRLTDEEIEKFAQGANVKEYAEKQGCLRWGIIQKTYF